jgi:fimbrial chaperone protein
MVASALVLAGLAVHATSVDINPVRIDLVGQNRPAELRLTNTGETELSVQIDTLQWVQDLDGTDQLVETDDLLAVPPLFTVPPGAQQIVRIGYLGVPDAELERSYRLLVTELAPDVANADGSSALNLRMRFSIPAFVAPGAVAARPEIVLREVTATESGTVISLENTGNGHARLSRLEARTSRGWEPVPDAMSVRYLLPGTIAGFLIPSELGPLTVVRIGTIDGRDWEYVVRSQN